jgi:hypothetical protein
MSVFMSKEWCEPEWLTDPAPKKRSALKKACVLTDGGVREHLLDVVLHEREGSPDQNGDPTDRRHWVDATVADRESMEEDGVDAGPEVDTGHDHRGRVDERGHRRRPGHGVGQPGVQRELTRLAHDREHQRGRAPQDERVADLRVRRGRVQRHDIERTDARRALHDEERHDHAGEQTDVAGAGGEEGLERGVAVGLLLPPVTDQHERAHTDELPTDEELQGVVGYDEQQHRRGEERQRRVEVGESTIAAHVLERVDVDEQRDQGDDEHHQHREAVDLDADGEAHAPVLEPREVM